MTFIPVTTTSRLIPNQEELLDPFSVDAFGAVAVTSDPSLWARQHILALLLTSPGERVMRPNYGNGILAYTFENQDPLRIQQLASSIKSNISLYEPSIQVKDVMITPNTPVEGVVQIGIDYSVLNSVVIHTFTFSISGQGIEL